jgi:hypothetical protein
MKYNFQEGASSWSMENSLKKVNSVSQSFLINKRGNPKRPMSEGILSSVCSVVNLEVFNIFITNVTGGEGWCLQGIYLVNKSIFLMAEAFTIAVMLFQNAYHHSQFH